jgi:Ras-related protein Rab-37
MTTDDSMSEDVFESPEDAAMTETGGGGSVTNQMNMMSVPGQHTQLKTPSPTGYRDYKPPVEMLKLYEQQQEETEQMVHKVCQNCCIVF